MFNKTSNVTQNKSVYEEEIEYYRSDNLKKLNRQEVYLGAMLNNDLKTMDEVYDSVDKNEGFFNFDSIGFEISDKTIIEKFNEHLVDAEFDVSDISAKIAKISEGPSDYSSLLSNPIKPIVPSNETFNWVVLSHVSKLSSL